MTAPVLAEPLKPNRLTDAELDHLAAFLQRVRGEWKNARTPEARADLEKLLLDTINDRASAIIRRSSGRCEYCGDQDKDARIRQLEADARYLQGLLNAVWDLVDRHRKTVRMDDLRAALDPETGFDRDRAEESR